MLFADLAALGSFRLGLTGGEPLLRRELFDIMDCATDAGRHPCVTTNGFFITEAVARKFAARELIWLNVSLDGATAPSNDAIRGAGSFDRAVAGIRTLARFTRFTIAFTLTRENVDEIEDCVTLARKLGAHTPVFRAVYPAGAARDQLDLMPSFEAYQGALLRLTEADVRPLDPFSPQARAINAARVVDNGGCGAANTTASIGLDGRVSPCSFLGPEFDGASVRDEPFEAIWRRGHRFAQLRDTADEAFAGGCRARSLAMTGSVHNRDPWEMAWRESGRIAPDDIVEVHNILEAPDA